MARKTIKIPLEDRGVKKTFVLTEMSAVDAENLALELAFAMGSSGVEIPDELADMGFAGLAKLGLTALSKIPFEKAKPMLDRLMACVEIAPNPNKPDVVRALVDEDIEDPKTRLILKKEVIKLHLDFLNAASPSTSA